APAKVLAALDKDLNAPQALAALGELAKAANEVVLQIAKLKKDKPAQDEARKLAAPAANARGGRSKRPGGRQSAPRACSWGDRAERLAGRGLEASAVDAKIKEREAARAGKDFARADALRGELVAMGIEVLDAGGESTWRVVLG